MDKEIINREVTEDQRQDFIKVARAQGHKVSDNVQLKPVPIEDILGDTYSIRVDD